MIERLKALAGTLRKNMIEVAVYCLISFGLPWIVYAYIDLKAAVSVFIVLQIVLGVLSLREGK